MPSLESAVHLVGMAYLGSDPSLRAVGDPFALAAADGLATITVLYVGVRRRTLRAGLSG